MSIPRRLRSLASRRDMAHRAVTIYLSDIHPECRILGEIVAEWYLHERRKIVDAACVSKRDGRTFAEIAK